MNLSKIMKYSASLHAKGSWMKSELYFEEIMKLGFKLFDPPKRKDFIIKYLEKTMEED